MGLLDYRRVSDFFKAFSHPTRVMIITELQKGRKCVSDIKELVEARQPNISQHLAVLKSNDIIDWRQEGKRKCYFLKDRCLIKNIIKAFEKSALGKPY